jgi:hypothetical protein
MEYKLHYAQKSLIMGYRFNPPANLVTDMFNSDYYLLIITMAEQMFMFAITAGFMIGLGIILGIARTRRSKTATKEVTNEPSPSSSPSSSSSGESQERKRVKRYNSEGKPVYE